VAQRRAHHRGPHYGYDHEPDPRRLRRQLPSPINWQTTGNWSWFRDIGGKNNEIKSGIMSLWQKSYTLNFGYPNQQQYRYKSTTADLLLPGGAQCVGIDCNYFSRPNSVITYDYPNNSSSVSYYSAWYLNDKITLSAN